MHSQLKKKVNSLERDLILSSECDAYSQLCVKSKKLMDLLLTAMKNEQVICIYALKHIK